ncbi:MAG: DUF3459 domain-containing protein, partial [Succinivibrio sp.]
GEFRDLLARTEYEKCLAHGFTREQALACISQHSRDQARTPMLWDSSENAGFTTGTPWIRLHQDWRELNAKAELADPGSVLNWYRKLIAIRKSKEHGECLSCGDFAPLPCPDDSFMAYSRKGGGEEIRVYANFSERAIEVEDGGQLVASTGQVRRQGGRLETGPGAAAVTARKQK